MMNKTFFASQAIQIRAPLLAALFYFFSAAVSADVTFYYEGDIIGVDAPLESSVFRKGQKIRGSITFDETANDPNGNYSGLAFYQNAIVSMSLHTPKYALSGNTGNITRENEDETFYALSFHPVSGDNIGEYSPESLIISWTPYRSVAPEGFVDDFDYPLTHPLFNANPGFPQFLGRRATVYDIDGNLVYSDFEVLVDDLDYNQPFFDQNGRPVPFHGVIRLSYTNEQSTALVTGDLTSVTLVPRCNDQEATIYVNAQGMIVGGPQDGQVYRGVLKGTGGNDVMRGTESVDEIRGKGGNDIICGLNGDDVILGGEGDDTLYGGAGNDLIKGQNGKDQLFGNAGNDVLHGGRNLDGVHGGANYDRCYRGEAPVVSCELVK